MADKRPRTPARAGRALPRGPHLRSRYAAQMEDPPRAHNCERRFTRRLHVVVCGSDSHRPHLAGRRVGAPRRVARVHLPPGRDTDVSGLGIIARCSNARPRWSRRHLASIVNVSFMGISSHVGFSGDPTLCRFAIDMKCGSAGDTHLPGRMVVVGGLWGRSPRCPSVGSPPKAPTRGRRLDRGPAPAAPPPLVVAASRTRRCAPLSTPHGRRRPDRLSRKCRADRSARSLLQAAHGSSAGKRGKSGPARGPRSSLHSVQVTPDMSVVFAYTAGSRPKAAGLFWFPFSAPFERWTPAHHGARYVPLVHAA